MDHKSLIESAKNITEIAPQAYDDILHPSAQNTGTALGTITNLINTMLTPVEIINKTVSMKKEKFLKDYEANLNKIPIENQCVPRLEIAGPIIEHAKYKITEDTLREKYAKLLSAASNVDNLSKPLLSFDNVLNQLSPYEIDLLTQLFKQLPERNYPLASINITSECGYQVPLKDICNISFKEFHESIISVMLSNLDRLGLITIDRSQYVEPHEKYDYIFHSELYLNLKEECDKTRNASGLSYPSCSIQKYCFYLTEFGRSFVSVIIC